MTSMVDMKQVNEAIKDFSCDYGPWAANAAELYGIWGGPAAFLAGVATSALVRGFESNFCFKGGCDACRVELLSINEVNYVAGRAVGKALYEGTELGVKSFVGRIPWVNYLMQGGKYIYATADTIAGFKQRQIRLEDTKHCTAFCIEQEAKRLFNFKPNENKIPDEIDGNNHKQPKVSNDDKNRSKITEEQSFQLGFRPREGELMLPNSDYQDQLFADNRAQLLSDTTTDSSGLRNLLNAEQARNLVRITNQRTLEIEKK